MNLYELDVLKLMMSSEPELKRIFEYFLDHFGEDAEFMSHGQPLTDARHPLRSVIETVGRQILARHSIKADPIRIQHQVLVHLPEYNLIHGGMLLQGRMANVLYFEDLMVGVMYVMLQPNEFARFTLARAPSGSSHNN